MLNGTLQLFGKTLKVIRSLGFGKEGEAFLVKDTNGKEYVLKRQNLGFPIDGVAKILKQVGRFHGLQKNVRHPSGKITNDMLIEYFPGKNLSYFFHADQYHLQYECGPDECDIPEDYIAFHDDYLKNPCNGFPTGLARNLILALRLIEGMERIHQKDVLPSDVRDENIIILESNGDIKADFIDIGDQDISAQPDKAQLKRNQIFGLFDNMGDWGLGRETPPFIPREIHRELMRNLGSDPSPLQIKAALQNLIDKEYSTTPYFAYGSNLDINQMKERVGFVGNPEKAKLTGYKLVFNKYAQSRDCGVANIVYTGNPNDVIEGVVYQLTQAQLAKLDVNEGAKLPNPNGYKRKEIQLANGTQAQVYIANVVETDPRLTPPSVDYLRHLLRGLRNGFISEAYARKLGELAVKEGGKLKNHVNLHSYAPQGARPAPAPVAPAPVPVPVAPAPIAFRDRQNPQADLEYCVQHGLNKGISNALAAGGKLNDEIIAKIYDADYKRNNPKSHEVIAQAYLAHCVKKGLQKGAVHAINAGAKLSASMMDQLNDARYQRNNPKMMEAMTLHMERYERNRRRAVA